MIKKNIEKLDNQFFLLTRKALPEVLLLVLKAKNLVNEKNFTVAEATKKVGLSRTTYYKYYNDVYYYNENSNSNIFKLEILNYDKVGILSKITESISKNKFNILTINQGNPIKGLTKISISIIKTVDTCSIAKLINSIKKIENIKEVNY